MSNFERLIPVEFPRTPESVLSNDSARSAIAKASAYLTFALEEAEVDHSRDAHAAFVTDATHTLKENRTAEEYLELSIQELAYAESELSKSESKFQSELAEFRKELQTVLN